MSLIIFFNLVAIGPRGIRVNSVNPAAVKTDMFNKPDGPGGSNEKKQAVSNEGCMICYVNKPRSMKSKFCKGIYFYELTPAIQNIFLSMFCVCSYLNTLRPRERGRNFAYDIFKCIFLNEDIWISIDISLKYVP